MKYATPEILVDTQWVATQTLGENLRIVEVDYDPQAAYDKGHVPGASLISWKDDINDNATRDIVGQEQFEALMSKCGITPDTTVILYGDFHNWFATFALWVFKIYGHKDVRIMNGGRTKWELEGRSYDTVSPQISPTEYEVTNPSPELRVLRKDITESLSNEYMQLVDVRSPPEFQGLISAPGEYPTESAQRAGHIPGATNIPWLKAVNEKDGTFKSADDLSKLYRDAGVTPDKNVITYCRIGERSSHTWLVLKYLLGYPTVVNYDGSWTEWGNAIGAPIER